MAPTTPPTTPPTIGPTLDLLDELEVPALPEPLAPVDVGAAPNMLVDVRDCETTLTVAVASGSSVCGGEWIIMKRRVQCVLWFATTSAASGSKVPFL